jgi:signal peptidase II
MPQKRNPDLAEVIKGKANWTAGMASALLGSTRGAMTGYNRDIQLTKYAVRSSLSLGESFPEEGFFRITYVTNTGAAFGILKDQSAFLIVTTFFGLAAIILYYIYPPLEHGILRIALGLQLGGAIGNLTDRVRMGHVTDFIDVGAWPAFNVADSSIVIGVAVILTFFVLSEGARRRSLPP